jgi:predicted secreted protein
MLKREETEKEEAIHFTQEANGSSGEHWQYELDNNNVIQEKKYYETDLTFVLAPGHTQHWLFEQIGVGEVTITWKAYEGRAYQEEKSYRITYYFDDQGEYTVLKDTREDK